MNAVKFHLRMYTCGRCFQNTAMWMRLPAPKNIVLVGGGCEHCTTPAPKFTRKGQA